MVVRKVKTEHPIYKVPLDSFFEFTLSSLCVLCVILIGFVVMNKKKERTAMAKILPRAFLTIANGTAKQASDYCKKEMDFDEFGELPLPRGAAGGKATADAYAATKALAIEGNLDDICAEHYVKHYATLKRIATDNRPIPPDLDWEDGETPNIWYYGPTGTGKSRRAREENPGKDSSLICH